MGHERIKKIFSVSMCIHASQYSEACSSYATACARGALAASSAAKCLNINNHVYCWRYKIVSFESLMPITTHNALLGEYLQSSFCCIVYVTGRLMHVLVYARAFCI